MTGLHNKSPLLRIGIIGLGIAGSALLPSIAKLVTCNKLQ